LRITREMYTHSVNGEAEEAWSMNDEWGVTVPDGVDDGVNNARERCS
jgi:hypothetical protein